MTGAAGGATLRDAMTEITVTDFLRTRVPFLAGLQEAEARELAAAARRTSYPKGKLVVMQGETVDSVHVIAGGKVAVSRKEHGKQPVALAELGLGDVFGETSIMEMGVAGASIRALEDTLILSIPQAAFLKAIAANPQLKAGLLEKIAARRPKPA